MKNDRIIDAFNKIQPSGETRERIFEKSRQTKHKRPIFKSAVAIAAAAAMICLLVFGGSLLQPQDSGNMFAVKAYAVEQQADGSIELRTVDIVDRLETWGGIMYNGKTYIGVGLKCEGENIKSVEFSTDSGFFAKQDIEKIKQKRELGDEITYLFMGSERNMILMGMEFEELGKRFSMDKDTDRNSELIFWGVDGEEMPSAIVFDAIVTFEDGTTQTETVTIELDNTIGVMIHDTVTTQDGVTMDSITVVDGEAMTQDGVPLESKEITFVIDSTGDVPSMTVVDEIPAETENVVTE